jgi:hypothetical protein
MLNRLPYSKRSRVMKMKNIYFMGQEQTSKFIFQKNYTFIINENKFSQGSNLY